jgi:two-component system cell cycle sensor histidine kinase/response regulator CckA
MVATVIGSLALVFIYFYLFVQYRERYMGVWAISWALYTFRLGFELWILLAQGSPWLTIGNQASSLISGVFLLWGAYLFRGKDLPHGWVYGSIAGVVWIIAAALLRSPFIVLTLPTFTFLGAVYAWTGLGFLRFKKIAGAGKQVIGWAFILWGIHKINYPFIKPLAGAAPWGYLMAAILELTVAIGILLVYFKKTREDLSEREEQYRSLFQNNHAVMLLTDPESADIVDANPAACTFYGFSREELTAKKITDINTLTNRQVSQEMRKARQKKQNRFSFRHRLASGEIRDVEVYSGPIGVHGKTLLYSIIHDVTDRRRTEEKLHATMSQFAALIDNMCEGILFEDKTRRIALVNQPFCSMFDFSEGPLALLDTDCREAIQKVSARCVSPIEFTRHIEEIIGNGNAVANERILFSDGRVFERDYIPIFFRGAYLGHLWQYRDVTDRQKLHDQLRHAQKMEAVGTLAGGLAHDFNNILTAIIGYANLVKLGIVSGKPLDEYVDRILASSERAAGLTQGLLAFSRKQAISLRPLELNGILRRVEKLLRRLIGEDLELTTTVPAGNTMVLGDSGQIEQVFMNLATNARDAMQDGGHLSIELSHVTLDDAFSRVHGYGKPGLYALIAASDTGAGMEEKTRERIFEPFFTTKEVGRGTGLGLAIVYSIVKQHNGYINCYSEPGTGTTFKIYLPLTLAESREEKAAEASAPMSGNETILLAEDDAEVRKLMKTVLEEFGYTVITADDGEDATQKFSENSGKIRLAVLDVVMPKKGGTEVYSDIKKIRPDIKALFTSGYTENVMLKKGILGPGMHFISKPVSPKDLLRKVREVLDQ